MAEPNLRPFLWTDIKGEPITGYRQPIFLFQERKAPFTHFHHNMLVRYNEKIVNFIDLMRDEEPGP